jgi:hypothetical protein
MSLPLLLVLTGVTWFFVADGGKELVGWYIGAAGIALQLIFRLAIACPKCGKSPYALGPSCGPFGWAYTPVPEAICSKCGFDLRVGDATTSIR